MQALAPDEVVSVNVDVLSAVATTFGAAQRLRSHRDLIRQLPGFDLARFDRLDEYAMALGYAHGRHETARRPDYGLPGLYQEAARLRTLLHVDVTALIGRGFVSAEASRKYTGLNGYQNVASDLQILARVLRDRWPVAQGKCAAQQAEVDRAFLLMERILRASGHREQDARHVPEAADLRARAFTLLVRAYEDARRAICFLRREQGDAEDVVPSLFLRKGRSRKRAARDVAPGFREAPRVARDAEPAPAPVVVPTSSSWSAPRGHAQLPVPVPDLSQMLPSALDRAPARPLPLIRAPG
jgi:hypothetical protein